jgi:hypothetical protein
VIVHEGVPDDLGDSCRRVVFFDMVVCATFSRYRESLIFTDGSGTSYHRNVQCDGD